MLPKDHPVKRDFESLSEWMKSGGSKVNKCKIRYFTENFRGVCATQDIKAGEILVFSPYSQMITPKSVQSNIFSQEVMKMSFKSMNPGTMAMTMFVMSEIKNEFNRFNAFLSGIPKSFDEYPIRF